MNEQHHDLKAALARVEEKLEGFIQTYNQECTRANVATARLEEKLEAFIEASKQDCDRVDARLNHHSARITSLEKFQAKMIGIAVASAFLSSLAVRFLPQFFNH